MRVDNIETKVYRLPLKESFISSKYAITHQELVLSKVHAGKFSGTGWAMTVGVGGLAIKSLLDKYLSQLVIGEDARNTEQIWSALWEDCHFLDPGGVSTMAIATIDVALWDIKAKAADEPLHRLLGGMRTDVPVYASTVNLHKTTEQVLAQIEGYLNLGYSAFKIKVGRVDPYDDLERCRAVRKLIGPSRTLLIDANQKWSLADATYRLQMLSEVRPGWIEEPMRSDDVAGHARLRGANLTPIAVGEQLCNRFDFWNYVRENAVDVLQPSVWKVGGITEWLAVAGLARSANLPISSHAAIELSQHLMAAIPNSYMAENLMGASLSDLGAVDELPAIKAGVLVPPDRPGHGVEFNFGAIRKFEIDQSTDLQRKITTHSGV